MRIKKRRSFLEPEDILIDDNPRLTHTTLDRHAFTHEFSRLFVFSFIVVIGLGILFIRSVYLAVAQHGEYSEMAQINSERITWETSSRGAILDSYGEVLARNTPRFDLVMTRQELPFRSEEVLQVFQDLSELTNVSIERLDEALAVDLPLFVPITIETDLSQERVVELQSKLSDQDVLSIYESSKREYLKGESHSHILGYTGPVTPEFLREHDDYLLTDNTGKTGVEAQYEKILRGEHGKTITEANALGRRTRIKNITHQTPGHDIVLTIDSELQETLHKYLKSHIYKRGSTQGSAVAIDPRTGNILALASYPTFDNNIFSSRLDPEVYNELLNDPNRPFFNKAIAGTYPPGSTFKTLIAAATLEEDLISPYKVIYAPPYISIPNQYNPEIVYTFRDFRPRGNIDMIDALAVSSNVYFYIVGGGYEEQRGLGIQRIHDYSVKLGFGAPTGIDLPGERGGIIPTKEWKQEAKGEPWYVGDTYHAAIGQGDVLVTPLQLAHFTTILANGGTQYRPKLIHKTVDPATKEEKVFQPIVLKTNALDAATLSVVREGMRQAVVRKVNVPIKFIGVEAAGKTGTAQYGNNTKEHSWYTSFAPFDEPEIVVTSMIVGGGEGYLGALPVAADVMKWYFENRD